MLLQIMSPPRSWPAAAVHDTVAAVMRQRAYQRSLRVSIMDRVFQWIGDALRRVGELLGAVPHGRAVATACAVAIVVMVLARLAYTSQLREDEVRSVRRRSVPRAGTEAPWDEAQRLAATGRYEEAAHALYRALLHVLVVRERLRLHPSKTSGDYARELRARDSQYYAAFRMFGRRYDRILFGVGACDAAAYDQLLREARPMLEQERAA